MRASGGRLLSGNAMSVEDKIYKQHYACFNCRKAFKKTHLAEVPKQRVRVDDAGRVVHCPQCGERMPEVGYDFKPPKTGDVKAWAEARAKVTGTLEHAIRNSRLVGVKSRRRLKKFREAYDGWRGDKWRR